MNTAVAAGKALVAGDAHVIAEHGYAHIEKCTLTTSRKSPIQRLLSHRLDQIPPLFSVTVVAVGA